MARSIYVYRGELDEPEFEDPENPIDRDRVIDLLENELEGMIRYRVLGKHFYTHNSYGLEVDLPFETMPCIRFDLRKTGLETLKTYLHKLANEFGAITVFNPEQEHIQIREGEDPGEEDLQQLLWPKGYKPSIQI